MRIEAMTDATNSHPSAEELRAFALGLIEPLEDSEFQRHLASCAVCSQQLLTIPDDAFVKFVRNSVAHSGVTHDTRSPEPPTPADASVPSEAESDQAEREGRVPAHATAARPPLQQVGDYRLLREVGRGGMGVVYEAEQLSLGRRVALKLLALQASKGAMVLERFRREAKAAARLHHTNIVPVFEVGQDGDTCFYAMQFIQGQGLDQVIEELRRLRHDSPASQVPRPAVLQPVAPPGVSEAAQSLLTGHFELRNTAATPAPTLPGDAVPTAPADGHVAIAPGPDAASIRAEKEASSSLSSVESDHRRYFQSVARIGHQTATALAYAHARGIIHRDIKPSNLLLDAVGAVWVTDFGLAKTEDDGLTNPGDLVGTLRYMAPERFRGECDVRADVYALGLTLYELLVLKPAFVERDHLRLLEQIKEREPARPRSLDPRIPRDLEIIVLKASDKDPGRRYQTAEELAEDLRRFLAGEPIKARRTGELERLRLWCRRQPAVAGLTAALLLLVLTVAIGSTLLVFRLRNALDQSEKNRARAEGAELSGKHKLWESYLAEAQARRMSHQPGRRFVSLRAIQKALELPPPPGRSRAELRTEAIAALCLSDLEVAKEWNGWPLGSSAFAIDPAFERYARGDKDGNVTIRRLSDDAELLRLPGIGVLHAYDGLRFGPDGRLLHQVCHVGQGLRARLWKLDGPQPVAVLDDDYRGFAFRPDGRQLAAGYADGTIRLYDTESGQEVRRFSPGIPNIGFLSWNPKLPQIALGLPHAWRLLDANTGLVQPAAPVPGGFTQLDWHPEGRLLAVSTQHPDSKICLFDASTRQLVLPPFQGHKNGGIVVRFNHAGDRLLSTDWNHLWRLWDVRTGQQLLTLPATTYNLDFGPVDRMLGTDLAGSTVRLFQFRRGEEFRTVVHQDNLRQLGYARLGLPVLDPSGRLLATAAGEGVALVDISRSEEVAFLKVREHAAIGFEPEGALLTAGSAGVLRWPLADDPATGRRRYGPPERLAESGNLHFHGVSADGQVIATPTGNGAVVRHRLDGRTVALGPQQDVRDCAVSPDGRWAATGSHGPQSPGVKIWEAHSGKHVKDLPAGLHGLPRFSPDGKWLLTTGGGCRLWQVGTWQEGPDLGETPGSTWGAFAPDSKLLAVGDAPGVVRLVETGTGREIARLTAPEQARLAPCCFTLDGAQLITASPETRALHIFDLRAIRAQLVELGLDWDAPPLPPAVPGSREPLQVEVEEGKP
jgi:serine/threonine protein kinase/WD40 repeat protein